MLIVIVIINYSLEAENRQTGVPLQTSVIQAAQRRRPVVIKNDLGILFKLRNI